MANICISDVLCNTYYLRLAQINSRHDIRTGSLYFYLMQKSKVSQKTSKVSRRILMPFLEPISTRVDISATFNLECDYGHARGL